jgi:hypothetical protein
MSYRVASLGSSHHRGHHAEITAREPVSASPTVQQTFLKYLKSFSGVKNMVLKSTAVFFDIASICEPSNLSHKKIANFAKDAKNYTEIAALPGAVTEVHGRFWGFVQHGSLEDFAGLVRKVAEFFVPVADCAKAVSNRCFSLGSRTMAVIGFAGSAATVLAMCFGIREEGEKLRMANSRLAEGERDSEGCPLSELVHARQKTNAEAQVTNSCVIIARNVHYAALGAFSVAATLMGVTAPQTLMVALAAGGLALTVIGHFHTEMVLEPAQKGFKEALVVSEGY